MTLIFETFRQRWPTVLSKCTAVDLRLYNLKLPSLEGIDKLASVRRLKLEWATKIDTLAPVFKLDGLTYLAVQDFPNLRQLDGVEAPSELTELCLSGNLGGSSSPLRLNSIEAVSRIPKLTTLSLAHVKLEVDDISEPRSLCAPSPFEPDKPVRSSSGRFSRKQVKRSACQTFDCPCKNTPALCEVQWNEIHVYGAEDAFSLCDV